MGLCKCPKRKVTQHFCFEHRVNVCEYCMIHDHVKCVIQPYLQWLEDSSYSSNCRFCNHPLQDEVCIRLLCYHLFHWRCFNRYAQDHPANTSPAGYTCPDCNCSVFPPLASNSPLCLQLRNLLANAEWAKEGLGQTINGKDTSLDSRSNISFSDTSLFSNNSHDSSQIQVVRNHNHSDSSCVPININSVSSFIESTSNWTCSTRSSQESRLPLLLDTDDVDEDKYKSKSPSEFLTKWFKSRSRGRPSLGNIEEGADYTKYVIPGVIIGLILLTLIHFFLKYGRESAEHDLSLDPAFNPNIRVQDQ